MPTMQDTVVTAAKGIDAQDFLDHIGWTDVIQPRLEGQKAMLTKRLVDAVLTGAPLEESSKERIAGQIYGIDYAMREIEAIVTRGHAAEGLLADAGMHLKDFGLTS